MAVCSFFWLGFGEIIGMRGMFRVFKGVVKEKVLSW